MEQPYEIFLVEDNKDDVFLTEHAIKECNINAKLQVASDGKQAIEFIKKIINLGKKLPDLILLDINLPKVTGLDVLKHLKSSPATSSIPTVVFTSSDYYGDMKYSYEIGAELFIRKPNNIKDFKEIIQYIKNYVFKQWNKLYSAVP